MLSHELFLCVQSDRHNVSDWPIRGDSRRPLIFTSLVSLILVSFVRKQVINLCFMHTFTQSQNSMLILEVVG